MSELTKLLDAGYINVYIQAKWLVDDWAKMSKSQKAEQFHKLKLAVKELDAVRAKIK